MSDAVEHRDPGHDDDVDVLRSALQRERDARREAEHRADEAARQLTEAVEEQRRTNRELQRVNADLEAFVYTTSHDLKSPLVTVIGYLDVLRMELADSLTGDQADYLERIRAQAGYMRDLVRDLLELSRVGRVSTEVSRVPTAAIVRELAEDRTRRHDGLEVVVDPLPDLELNPVRCRQVFANLLDNAIAHSGRDRVRVEVSFEREDDGGVVFCVRDDGRGIPAVDRERVFGPFERQVQGPRDGADPGELGTTGLGLTICRKIVRSYHGDIWAEPRDDGAEIRFRLPASTVAR